MGSICSIDGCTRSSFGHGYCNAHYSRWRRHGSPLGGSTPRGSSAGSPRRFIDELLVLSGTYECLKWPFSTFANGYPCVRRSGKTASVISLICEKFHGPAPTPNHEAAHSCGKGHEGCVNPMHLSWKTGEENAADKIKHGTYVCGERQNGAKLTPAAVVVIRSLRGKKTQKEIGAMFGVKQSTVRDIQLYRSWTHV